MPGSNPNNVLRTLRTKFKVKAVIDGIAYEVVHVVLKYGISSIPQASAMLAVGRNVATLEPATVHSRADSFNALSSFQLVLEAEGQFSATQDWPEGEHIIFDGFLTGFGNRRSNGRTHAVVHGIHWFSELAYSSALSGISHPSNPIVFGSPGSHVIPGAGSSQRAPAFITDHLTDVTDSGIIEDVWGSGIKKFLCNITNADIVRFELDRCGGDGPPNDNTRAQAALQRIEGVGGGDCDFDYQFGVPTQLNDEAGLGANIAYAMADAIGRESVNAWHGTTMWHKILQYVSMFQMAVIPMAMRGLVVPFMPSFRDPWRTINLEDYEWDDYTPLIPRPIRSVAIYGTKGLKTGIQSLYSGEQEVPIGFGGCFSPPGQEEGVFLVRKAPFWLASLVEIAPRARKTTGTENKLPVDTDGQQPSTPADFGGKTSNEVARDSGNIFVRYAQSIYFTEVLRGRVAQLSGKVRFDIAPGSTVRIEGTGEPFTEDDQLSDTIVGTVNGVSIGINAESSIASTGLNLSYIRTEQENESEAFSTAEHPLYKTTWNGAPLVETLGFTD